MDFNSSLTDLERKIITVLQHHNKRGKKTTLLELEIRLGHPEKELQSIIDGLIKRNWIELEEGEWMVIRKLL